MSQLFDIDISEYEFAAVLDKVGHIWVRYDYCNSGVLLLNFENIKKSGLFVKESSKSLVIAYGVNPFLIFFPCESSRINNFVSSSKITSFSNSRLLFGKR